MQQEHQKDTRAVMLGQAGGIKRAARLSAQERRDIARHAAKSRWHPLEAKAAREQAQEITRLIKLALKDGGQIPLA